MKAAELTKAGGCDEFHLMTSKGSNHNSWLLYPSTKVKQSFKSHSLKKDKDNFLINIYGMLYNKLKSYKKIKFKKQKVFTFFETNIFFIFGRIKALD